MNLMSMSHGGGGNQDGQEVLKHRDSDNIDVEEDEESPSGAHEQNEVDEMVAAIPGRSTPAAECLPSTILEQMEKMFLELRFSQLVVEKPLYDKGIDFWLTLTNIYDLDITMF